MTTTIEIDIDKLLQKRSDQIADLQLCLKETNILLVASIGREKELMGAIARHKWNKYKDDECIEDVLLWELLGEVEG